MFIQSAEYRLAIDSMRFNGNWISECHELLKTNATNSISVLLDVLEVHYNEFSDACFCLLGGLNPTTDLQEYEDVRTQAKSIRTKFIDLKMHQNVLSQTLPLSNPTDPKSASPLTQTYPIFMDLPIPTFDGCPDSWLSFIDEFDKVVALRPHLTHN